MIEIIAKIIIYCVALFFTLMSIRELWYFMTHGERRPSEWLITITILIIGIYVQWLILN